MHYCLEIILLLLLLTAKDFKRGISESTQEFKWQSSRKSLIEKPDPEEEK